MRAFIQLIYGQEFSNTTQIKFGQLVDSALGTDGLIIDNLTLTELSRNDLSLLSSPLALASSGFTLC